MKRLSYEEAVKHRPHGACYCNHDDRECYRRGHWNVLSPTKPRATQQPAFQYSDVELGVRLDDIRQAAELLLDAEDWQAVRDHARAKAVERNRADRKRRR